MGQAVRNAMTPLSLAPLPTTRADENSTPWQNGQVGFVDDAVVARLITPARTPRLESCPEDLALAADDLDFAGWQLDSVSNSTESAFCGTEDLIEVPPLLFGRATPPAIRQASIDAGYDSNHRWWIAGLAGVLATLVVTLLLLILSSRPATGAESLLSPTAANPATDSRR